MSFGIMMYTYTKLIGKVIFRARVFVVLLTSVSIAFSLTAEAQGLTTAATEKDAAALAQNLGDSYISEVKTKRARKGQPEDVDAFFE